MQRKIMTIAPRHLPFRFRLASAVVLAALAPLAHADDTTHVGLAVTAGLSGVGADIGVNINDFVGLRGTIAGFDIDRNGNYGTSVGWDAKLKLFQAGLLVDVYPFAGGFHLTGGAVQDGNKFTLTGQPSGGTYTFNGNSYPASQVGSAAATVDWSKTVPYLGLGWGNLAGSRGLHFTSDLGVLITGSPKSALAVTCNADPATCATMTADVQQEQVRLQNDVHNLSFWPVVRFGIGFSF
jgi:hypothetical protein